MKRNFYFVLGFVITVLFFSSANMNGQTIQSNGTGGGSWTSASTWQGGVVPDSSKDVIIAAGDSVILSASANTKVNSLTVQSSAILNNATVTGNALSVTALFSIKANGKYYSSTNAVSWPSAGTYSIDNTSTYIQASSASSSIGAAGNSTYGNLTISKSGTTAGAALTINGDLTINTGGSGNTFRGGTTTSFTHTVHGNVYLNSGQFSCVDVSSGASDATVIWNIDGNVTVNSSSSRIGPLTSALTTGTRTGIFNINGNFVLQNGCRLQAGSSTGSTSTTETGIFNLKGNLSIDNSVAIATNSKGLMAINFTGNGVQNVTLGKAIVFNSSSMSLTLNDTVASTATVVFNGGNSLASTSAGAANGGGSFVVYGTLNLGLDTLKGLQSFTLNDGAVLGTGQIGGITDSSADGSIQVTGTRTYSSKASYVYNGTAAQVTGDGLPASVKNLTISDTAGVTLTNAVAVTDTCIISNGAKLVESSGKYVKGLTTTTQAVGTGSSILGGIGVSLNAGADNLGNVTVTRISGTAGAVTIGGKTGINRNWTISSTTPPAAGRNLALSWDSLDNNGKNLATAQAWKSTNNGTSWSAAGSTQDISTSAPPSITVSTTSFSKWTVSDASNSLPVELVTFSANSNDAGVELDWKTATEINNNGWDIEKYNGSDWNKIGFVKGSGSTLNPKEYSFTDQSALYGKYQYRLKQIDFNGTFKYSNVVEVNNANEKLSFNLGNYPNPFNPTTTIRFELPVSSFVDISVYNILGQKVATLLNERMEKGIYQRSFGGNNMASGTYIYKLTAGNVSIVKKMLLLK
jgi:hypothetical protein